MIKPDFEVSENAIKIVLPIFEKNADLTEDEIKASIDLDGKEEGSYEVPVNVSVPKGYELVDEVTTGVEVSRISTADTGN